MNRFQVFASLSLFGAVAVGACSKPEARPEPTPVAQPGPPAAVAPVDDSAYAATTLFQTKCIVCHGTMGMGDGPGAAALNPKPRAFGDAAWQASVKDEEIGNTILLGGAAVGKSPAMPPNPDLQSKPEVIKELVKIVRAFKKG